MGELYSPTEVRTIRSMRFTFAILLALTVHLSAHAQGGGFSGFLRSITNAVGGSSDHKTSDTPATATLGIRGLDDGDTKLADGAKGDARPLETWAVGRTEAEAGAARRGLVARSVEFADPQAGKPAGAP